MDDQNGLESGYARPGLRCFGETRNPYGTAHTIRLGSNLGRSVARSSITKWIATGRPFHILLSWSGPQSLGRRCNSCEPHASGGGMAWNWDGHGWPKGRNKSGQIRLDCCARGRSGANFHIVSWVGIACHFQRSNQAFGWTGCGRWRCDDRNMGRTARTSPVCIPDEWFPHGGGDMCLSCGEPGKW